MGTLKLVFGVLVFFLISSQSTQDDETILWQENKQLSWEDFKGKAPNNNRIAATTASGITYSFSTSSIDGYLKIDFKVDTFFYPNKSWYHPELCDDVILSHEQLHFDISELFARKLRKKIAATTFTHKNVKQKIKALYKKTNIELNEFQNKYDIETNFSRDIENQLLWNKTIAEELKNVSFK